MVDIEVIREAGLDQGWDSNAIGWRICRPIGDEWLISRRTALLQVPSAANKGSFNYLINPVVLTAQEITVVETIAQPFPIS